jgi:hypothetical protein
MANRTHPLTAVVLSRNEQANIRDCLAGLSWCQQVVLIDHSTDSTLKLARRTLKLPQLKIYTHPAEDFSLLRNFGLDHADHDWVLFIDADHRVSSQLKNEIIHLLFKSSPAHQGYKIRQLDHFAGKLLRHGETAHIYHLLLGKKSAGRWHRRVHERWLISDPVGTLKTPLDHYPHPNLTEFLEHINRWSTLNAREFASQGVQGNLFQVITHPTAQFFLNYVIRLGFLDGPQGLVYALVMSFHSFLTRSKLYLLNHPVP